jgi:hypothetical protein
MGNTPTLKQWQHHAIRKIDFVSGAGEGEVEPAHLTDLIYGDPEKGIDPKVPNELIGIAERVEFEGIDAEAVKKMTPEERLAYQRFKEWLVADRLRSPKITAEQARTIPTDDFQQVLEIALHMDYRERVMLRSFRDIASGPASNGSGGHEGEASE